MRSVTITNRSEWPTWLVRWLVRRAAADAGITWKYRWTQRRGRGWLGRGGSFSGHATCPRRCVTRFERAHNRAWIIIPDSRIRDYDGETIPASSVAALAFIVRHELEHAADGHPSKWKHSDGRTRLADMELICNASAAEWVAKLGADWPAIFAEWRRLARADRAKRIKPPLVLRRMEEREQRLAYWERKMKQATAKVRQYRAAIRAAERRMAARNKDTTP